MTAQCSGAAALNSRQDLPLLAGEPVAAALDEGLSREADQIGHLQGWSTHLRIPRWLTVLSGCR